jgi:hypothetical protein
MAGGRNSGYVARCFDSRERRARPQISAASSDSRPFRCPHRPLRSPARCRECGIVAVGFRACRRIAFWPGRPRPTQAALARSGADLWRCRSPCARRTAVVRRRAGGVRSVRAGGRAFGRGRSRPDRIGARCRPASGRLGGRRRRGGGVGARTRLAAVREIPSRARRCGPAGVGCGAAGRSRDAGTRAGTRRDRRAEVRPVGQHHAERCGPASACMPPT